MTREREIHEAYKEHLLNEGNPSNGFEYGAVWADQNPSDKTIMRILNCIGYEEKSWIEFVRKELERRENNMEQIKSTASGTMCGDNRFDIIATAKEDILKSTNISESPKELEVLDSFLFRCWQMGWLNKYANFTQEYECNK